MNLRQIGRISPDNRCIGAVYLALLLLIFALEIYECLFLKSKSCLLTLGGHGPATSSLSNMKTKDPVHCKTFPLDKSGNSQFAIRGCNNAEGFTQLYLCGRSSAAEFECPVFIGGSQARRLHAEVTDTLEASVKERKGKCLPLKNTNSSLCFNNNGKLTNFTISFGNRAYTLNSYELIRLHSLIDTLYM